MEEQPAPKVGEIIKKLRLERRMTQYDFSRSLGIAQGYLSDIERGKKLPSDTLLIALAHRYGVPGGALNHLVNIPEALPRRKEIPLLHSVGGFATGKTPGEIDDYIRVPGVEGDCYAVIATGSFMAPTICDGDIVIFCRTTNLEHGDIAFLTNRWGEPILRRYRVKDREVYFASDNNAYAPFRPDSETLIIGKVHAVWRNVEFNPYRDGSGRN
jgi:repressor LexA